MARRDHEAELRRWLAGGGERIDLGRTLRALPATADAELAATAVVGQLGSVFGFTRTCRRLPAHVIRAVLRAQVDGPDHLFLRLAVPDDDDATAIEAAWERAVQALADTDLTYAWGSRQRRAKLRALAADPHLLQAIQGTVAHSKSVRLDLLAVLVIDGSDASFDALVPHVDPAFVHQDVRLERLERLRTHTASTPALDAMFAEIGRALDDRNAASPALALGPVIGLGELDVLWFDASIYSRALTGGNVPRIQGHVSIDSRRARWFSVSMARIERTMEMTYTSFDATTVHQDELGLGRCDAAGVPSWLAHIAATLQIQWDTPHVRSHLRGARRTLIERWLVGG